MDLLTKTSSIGFLNTCFDMLTITLGKKEEEAPWGNWPYHGQGGGYSGGGYQGFSPPKMCDTQELLDFYMREKAPFKKGDFLCRTYSQSIDGYGQIHVVTDIRTSLAEYLGDRRALKDPPSYFKIRALGVYQSTEPGDNGYSTWESADCMRHLTELEYNEWINDNVQAKLKEWGLEA